MSVLVPEIISDEIVVQEQFPAIDQREVDYINEAVGLLNSGFFSYSLLALWNAAVNNLKRKVEAYGVELWNSVVREESGRKKYDSNGETLAERWDNVDDLVLIKGATNLGLLNPKAGKSLEMINWMRNHASPAHDSDNRVEKEDVYALALLLQKNLFELPLPDPGHSISGIFDPIKNTDLSQDELEVLQDQIRSCNNNDTRTVFGFFIELVSAGNEPAYTNVSKLFPTLWDKANEDLKKVLGIKYHTLMIDPNQDDSDDQGAKTRLFEIIIKLNAVKYIPEGSRARIFRRAAEKLRNAKNTSYGWSKEESAALNLSQLGTSIPSVAFEEVYQEIIAVWCGNYWGRSNSHSSLEPYFTSLNSDKIRQIIKMFKDNSRVKDELSQSNPKEEAIRLLDSFSDKLTIEAHKQELKEAILYIKDL